MRLTTTKTLSAIALGIALATGAGAALSGSPDDYRGGRHGDPAARSDAHLARMTKEFNLTPEQQTQVRTIMDEERVAAEKLRAQTRQRIDGVLTADQRAARDARVQQGLERQLGRMAERLSLSADQTKAVRAILEERRTNPGLTRTQIKERIAAVLTPEQRERFATTERRGGRQGGNEGPIPGDDGAGPGNEGPGAGGDGPVDGAPDEPTDGAGPER